MRAALDRADATLVGDAQICTHCSPDHWSWRANGDKARQASVVWVPGAGEVPAQWALKLVAERLAQVRDRISKAGASPSSVRVVAVTKGFGPEAVEAAVGAGLLDLGENYAQELLSKASTAPSGVRWHFLGGLQRNKLARLAPHVHLWHGLDSVEGALALARRRPAAAVLVQVRTTAAGESDRPGAGNLAGGSGPVRASRHGASVGEVPRPGRVGAGGWVGCERAHGGRPSTCRA